MNREKEELKEILCSLIRTAPNTLSKEIAGSVADIRKALEKHYAEPRDVTTECRVDYYVDGSNNGCVSLYHGNVYLGTLEVNGFHTVNRSNGYVVRDMSNSCGFRVLKQ